MKSKTFCYLLICMSLLLAQDSNGSKQIFQPELQKFSTGPVTRSWGKLPYYFVQNKGQLNSDIEFHLKLQHGNVFFERHAITYQFISNEKVENLRIDIKGANRKVQLEGIGQKRAKMNFFQGNNPDNWIEQACSFEKLIYRNIYPQIDMVVYAQDDFIKHEYIVKKGGSVADIVMHYENVSSLQVNDRGQLEITTSLRTLKEDTPTTYQMINGKRVSIKSCYAIHPTHNVTFAVGTYDPNYDLIIDPSLLYSTYLGSSAQYHECQSIAVDLDLNTYVVGRTTSMNFPTIPGAVETTGIRETNAFLACVNSTGTELLYATVYGGSYRDQGTDVAFSWEDNTAVIVGVTYSLDLPTTPNAMYPTTNGNSDTFVAKFKSNGNLAYATYFGGSSDEARPRVAIDGKGKIYLAGNTLSSDLPTTPDAFDISPTRASQVFIAAFRSSGSLFYSTFFGEARFKDIRVDFDGNAYIAGDNSASDGIPITPGTWGEMNEDGGGFIAGLDPTGTSLLFSTWVDKLPRIGKRSYPTGIDVDGEGNIYVIGHDTVSNPYGIYTFVKKFNADASELIWNKITAVYENHSIGLVVDGRGSLYILGVTHSVDFKVTDDAFQAALAGPQDLFIQKRKTTNGKILYSTFLGGSNGIDTPGGLATDSFGSVYVAGWTTSFDFPTTAGVLQPDFLNYIDGFVVRIRDGAAKGQLQILPQKIKVKIPKNSSNAKTKSIKISNRGSGVVNYHVYTDQSWLTVSETGGNVRNEVDRINVTIDPKKVKKAGTHKGVVRISSEDAFNSPQQVPVQMIIPGPKIKVRKTEFTVTAEAGGENPLPLANRIKNSGAGKLRYRISPKVPWLSVTRKKGISTGEWDEFKIITDISDLTPGVYSGIIEVTDKDTVNRVEITITLNIIASN